MNSRAISDRKSLFDVILDVFGILHIGDRGPQARLYGIHYPRDEHRLDSPPIFHLRCVFLRLLDCPINESPLPSCTQGGSHRTCPLLIILTSKLDLCDVVPRIVIRIEIIRGSNSLPMISSLFTFVCHLILGVERTKRQALVP